MDRKELKSLAKQQIKGNIGILFVIVLVCSVLTVVASYIPIVGDFIVVPAFTIAITRIYIGIAAGKRPEVSDAFGGFKDFWISFKTSFFVGIFTMLWSLLFIIPGIVKSYSYMMAPYIVAEDPSVGALEAIARSERMMRGHKMEAFILELSFIGWILLSIVTFGIALIYAGPYMQTTMVNFYNKINPYNKRKHEDETFTAEA